MKLIDLAFFRKNNDMTQEDLASILNVSRAYISQVENGSNNLSDDKIDSLLEFNEQWNTKGLVPCFDRLVELGNSLFDTDHDHYCEAVELNPYYPKELFLPFKGVLPESTILLIRHGRYAISESIADTIVSVFPQVNKEWLTTGKGEMYVDPTKKNVEETKETLLTLEKRVSEELKLIKKEVADIKDMLKIILDKMS
jgi:transcriptional regulator with XRE-family HTH domain